jgi:hypothetical protein
LEQTELNFHDLRREAASRLLERVGGAHYVQKLCGSRESADDVSLREDDAEGDTRRAGRVEEVPNPLRTAAILG